MVAWLKYFFLGFFCDKFTEHADEHSFWNTVLAIVLAFVMLCTGLFAGFVCSFGSHVKNSSQFREFLSTALEGVELKIENGKLSAPVSINDFAELEKGEKLAGYGLIIETGPEETTFDDFSVMCTTSGGKEITYAEYLELSESERSEYTPQLLFSGKKLDVTVKQDEYKQILGKSESGEKKIAELDDKKAKGEISEKEYADEIYIAYVKAYYPSMSQVERYGQAPTLRTYYLGMAVSQFSDKFIMLLDNLCVGSFVTDDNIKIEFEGYYNGMPDGPIANAEEFLCKAFRAGNGYNYLLSILNMFRMMLIVFAAMLVIAALVFIAYRVKAKQLKIGYFGSLKIVGMYLFVSSILAAIVTVAASFFYAKFTAQIISVVTCVVITLIRTAVHTVMQIIKARKEDPDPAGDGI